ncbi:MAG: flavodoxin family protein, partial [Desulfurococcaceae archaeon]
THSDDVTKDSSALMDAYNVGYLVVETIKALKAYGKHIGYNPSVNVAELAEVARRAVNNDERNTRIRRLEALLSATLSI